MPHEQHWLDKEPKYVMTERKPIRGICITDCKEQDDYKKIVWLCEANKRCLDWSDVPQSLSIKFYPERLLYDDGDKVEFMHQWSAQKDDKEWFEEYKKTLKCMTVKEFYAKYAPEFLPNNKID